MEDEKKAKMGVVECVKHQLMDPFGVLFERDSEFVAQFKFTLLLMPNGPMRITGLPFDTSIYESQYKVEDEALKVISYLILTAFTLFLPAKYTFLAANALSSHSYLLKTPLPKLSATYPHFNRQYLI